MGLKIDIGEEVNREVFDEEFKSLELLTSSYKITHDSAMSNGSFTFSKIGENNYLIDYVGRNLNLDLRHDVKSADNLAKLISYQFTKSEESKNKAIEKLIFSIKDKKYTIRCSRDFEENYNFENVERFKGDATITSFYSGVYLNIDLDISMSFNYLKNDGIKTLNVFKIKKEETNSKLDTLSRLKES